jgi:hypothetical protein
MDVLLTWNCTHSENSHLIGQTMDKYNVLIFLTLVICSIILLGLYFNILFEGIKKKSFLAYLALMITIAAIIMIYCKIRDYFSLFSPFESSCFLSLF